MSIAATIHRQGRGTKLLLVHGGPGFSADYLSACLSFLAQEHEVIYYDQIREHEAQSQQLCLDLLAEQFLQVLSCLEPTCGPVQVIVHSWGALVIAAAAALDPDFVVRAISGGVVINPVPLDRPAYDKSIRNFVSSLPCYIKLTVPILATCGVNGAHIVRLLWPYYGPKNTHNSPPPESFLFDFQTYKTVTQSLGNFDYSSAIPNLKHLSLLLSSTDPTNPSLIQDWISQAKSVEVIEDGGHFPLQAHPDVWKEKLRNHLNLHPS